MFTKITIINVQILLFKQCSCDKESITTRTSACKAHSTYIQFKWLTTIDMGYNRVLAIVKLFDIRLYRCMLKRL